MKNISALFLIFLLSAAISFAQGFDDLALTPPMGWNSWNYFHCDVSENTIKQMADAMVSSGMKDAGYQYIVIDDCWQTSRDANGYIVADPQRFPSGMKALADYVHSLGLKFGLYSCAGTLTCQGRPGSHNYEDKDAESYAAWGVDYLKYDWCYSSGLDSRTSYKAMREALERAGRPIVFSICEWGSTQPWLWAQGIGHLWRTTGDIQATWQSFTALLDQQVGLEKYAGPGGWNDPDMLEVGNGNLTPNENIAHFSLWCLLAAPLMAGNDLRNMRQEVIDILTNKEVIAVNQDSLGIQGSKIRDEGDYEVWSKPMKDNSYAVILFNRSGSGKYMTLSWDEIGFDKDDVLLVRDLWKKQDVGYFQTLYSATVPAHGVVMIRLWHKSPPSEIPQINMITPADSSVFQLPGQIDLGAQANDADGQVVRVTFSANGLVVGQDENSADSWSVTWKPETPGVYQLIAYAMDNSGISAASAPIYVYLAPAAGPFSGTPVQLPALIEAENYDGGGEGTGYSDHDPQNQGGKYRWDGVDIGLANDNSGGYYVGWLEPGEWLDYSLDVGETDSCDFTLRVASSVTTGTCHLELDNKDVTGPVQIPFTGASLNWREKTIANISVPAGSQKLRFYVDAGGFNINSIDVAYSLQPLASPWLHRDIGQTGTPGQAAMRKGVFIVKASGQDIWGNNDEFHFVYQEVQGDMELSARVLTLEETDPWAKAGVMIRNSLTSTSNHAMTIVSAANGLAFQRRVEMNGTSTHTAGTMAGVPYWVRLVRTGNVLTGYESSDGSSWRRIDTETIIMQDPVYAGLIVTAHNDNVVCEASFDQVSLSTSTNVPPQKQDNAPNGFGLYPAYPNPFNSSATIRYDLPFDSKVSMSIYDIMGERVRVLQDGRVNAGSSKVTWDAKDSEGRDVASGLYLCKFEADDFTGTVKIVYLR
jgi:alpha-galactosidase